jgi:hypothetical protein
MMIWLPGIAISTMMNQDPGCPHTPAITRPCRVGPDPDDGRSLPSALTLLRTPPQSTSLAPKRHQLGIRPRSLGPGHLGVSGSLGPARSGNQPL